MRVSGCVINLDCFWQPGMWVPMIFILIVFLVAIQIMRVLLQFFLGVMFRVAYFILFFIVYLCNHVIPSYQFLWFLEPIYSFHFLVFI